MLHLAEGPRTIPSAGGLMRSTSAVPYDVIGLSMYTYKMARSAPWPIGMTSANAITKTSSSSRRPMPIPWPTADNAENSFPGKRRKDGYARQRTGNITIISRFNAGGGDVPE